MAAHELVESIQSLFPPSGQIPQPTSDSPSDDTDTGVEGLLPDLPRISRNPIPDWLVPGEGISFPADSILVIEGDTPAVQQGLPAAIDVLAHYLPFHFYAHGWGIYLRASGILSVASMLASATGRGLSRELLSLASAILLQHERFHFFSEIACSRGELVSEDELYRHYFHDRRAATIEEALSNAHAFRTALRRQPVEIREQVKQWMQAQGPGYRDFWQCVTPSAFRVWCRYVANRMHCTRGIKLTSSSIRTSKVVFTARRFPTRAEPAPTEFLFTGLADSVAPTYLRHDVPSLGVLRPFPKYAGLRVLVHTNDHPPPHIHVEIPPGRDFTRLEWPTLQPLPGDSSLTRKQQKSLHGYLSRFGKQVGKKIQEVYPTAA